MLGMGDDAPVGSGARVPGGRTKLTAWLLVVAVALPPILVRGASGDMVSAGLLGAGLIASQRNTALRSLRSFMIVWIAFLVTSAGLYVVLDASGLAGWTDRTPKYRWVIIVSSLILIPTLVMLATARALSLDLPLRRGDMSAPGLIPGTRRTASWKWLGLTTATAFLVGGAVWVWNTAQSSTSEVALVMSWLPAALLFAAVNPGQEEIRFRVVPLATLAPAVGDESAIWMTSAIFGLAHWSEATPSGPIGFIFHGLVGALLAKSILETRGIAWAWIIHAAGNFVLFIALVLDAN